LVCDTETRNANRAEARRFVTEACGHLRHLDFRAVYKKVDSALRGRLGTEIHTTMVELDLDLAILAPAFPEAGRVTVGGYHLVHGIPVDRTEVGRDPGAPVRGSYLPHLLDGHPDLRVCLLPLEDVNKGADHVLTLLHSYRGVGRTLVVADAASQEDLQTVARAASLIDPIPLLCGLAGLASAVSETLGLSADAPAQTASETGPTLFVVGTHESVTRDQVSLLKRSERVSEWEVHADHAAFAWERPHVPTVIGEISDTLERERHAILSLVGLHAGMHREDADLAMQVLGEMGQRIVGRVRPSRVVVSGGWTAVKLLRALEVDGVRIRQQIDVGTPLCEAVGGHYEGTEIVIKGGALGHPDTLLKAIPRVSNDAGERPILAITMGDVCGVGPEIIAKGLARPDIYDLCRPIVIGDTHALQESCQIVGVSFTVAEIASVDEASFRQGTVEVMSPIALEPASWEKGKVSPAAGKAAAEWVIEAVSLAMDDRIDGIVTAPLNKEAMNDAGYVYPGHTELLAEHSGGHEVRLMLASEKMSVAHVTGHIAIHEVPERLTQKRVYDTIALTRDALVRMGKPEPKLAVTGLNPHAGENGLFGEEDELVIKPAVQQAKANGWMIDGPLPADTTYFKAYDGEYDGVVAMYHDQGHAPMKLVAFDTAVNVTLGLPIVRTSVDHGTAFDIAGTGKAKEGNLIHAVRVGAKLASGRKTRQQRGEGR